jgi:hypothetical protein
VPRQTSTALINETGIEHRHAQTLLRLLIGLRKVTVPQENAPFATGRREHHDSQFPVLEILRL